MESGKRQALSRDKPRDILHFRAAQDPKQHSADNLNKFPQQPAPRQTQHLQIGAKRSSLKNAYNHVYNSNQSASHSFTGASASEIRK